MARVRFAGTCKSTPGKPIFRAVEFNHDAAFRRESYVVVGLVIYGSYVILGAESFRT